MTAPFAFDILVEEAESEGENDESNGNPSGSLGKLGIETACLILCKESIGGAGDGAGETCALSALEQNNGYKKQAAEYLKNSDNELQGNFIPFKFIRMRRYAVLLVTNQCCLLYHSTTANASLFYLVSRVFVTKPFK